MMKKKDKIRIAKSQEIKDMSSCRPHKVCEIATVSPTTVLIC
jgi:hypothetical protein